MPVIAKPSPFTAQYGEDRWIANHWRQCGLPHRGFFVEFGAGTGIYLSNSFWFEKVKHWNGLLIEADPRHTVEGRDCIIERCAVGPPGVASLGLHPTDGYLTGTRRESEQRVEVPSIPLSDLLRKHSVGRVDLISIDTEGTEIEAWRTLDLNVWRPTIAIVELFTLGLPDQSASVIAAMEADGYRLLKRTPANGIFKNTR